MCIPLLALLPHQCFSTPTSIKSSARTRKHKESSFDVRLVVETMNKLEALKYVVDAVTKDEFGYFVKQKNAFGH
jgi:hypothetical protein